MFKSRLWRKMVIFLLCSILVLETAERILLVREEHITRETANKIISDIYGLYFYDDGSSDVNTATIERVTEDGTDRIHILALSYGFRYTADVTGILIQTGDNTYMVTDEDSNCFKIVFDGNGMQTISENLE